MIKIVLNVSFLLNFCPLMQWAQKGLMVGENF